MPCRVAAILGLILVGGCVDFTSVERRGPITAASQPAFSYEHGGIVRGPTDRKRLALVFTGGQHGEGAEAILDALKHRGRKASFFVTGDFIRIEAHRPILRRMVAEGHYLGPHSDSHPLYCAWENRGKTLVTEAFFRADLDKNLEDLARYGPGRGQMRFFIPPYEWYNSDISTWATAMGIVLFNFTPGTRSNADYVPDRDPRFVSSRKLYESILAYEAGHADGLNGFLLLLHLGAGPGRTDKMHGYVAPLLDELAKRGYELVRVDELLGGALR
ncbi:MAG: polysaccharide deacetylase family protein [Phycisphaerae bacterium]|nr:polysaccharide deacetylase family protein [Phycisphaerae bacterium]